MRNVSLCERLTPRVTKKRKRYGHRTQETRTGNCAASACSRATAECAGNSSRQGYSGKEKSRSSEGWFNSKLKTKQLATAIPVELILIMVILVLLLGSVAAAVVDADEVFGSTHCSAACGIV